MRTINITFTVSERQYEYLKLAKCEQPNPQRMKMQLLSQAMSTLRREGEMVMNEAREQAHGPARLHPQASKAEIDLNNLRKDVKGALTLSKSKKRYKSPSQRELDARKAKLVLAKPNSNGKKPNPSDYSPTPLEDYEF